MKLKQSETVLGLFLAPLACWEC